jgi:twinkle protein
MTPREYLQKNGFTFDVVSRPSGDQLVMDCPFCKGGDHGDHKTFAMNADSGAFNCTRMNKCGKSGSFYTLQQLLGGTVTPLIAVRTAAPRRAFKRPVPSALMDLSSDASLYLTKERMLSPMTLKAWGIHSIRDEEDTIAFPYYKDGILVNIKYRHRDGGKSPWKGFHQEKEAEPCLYGHDMVSKDENTLVIVEGELDALSLWQYGVRNVVSVPDGANSRNWIEPEWDWLNQFKVIYLALDNDEAGRKGSEEIARRLGCWRCQRVIFGEKDANDFLRAQHTSQEYFEALRLAEDYKPPILVTAGQFRDEVISEMESYKEEDGLQTDFPLLNGLLHGFRPGELSVWTGRNGSGKSTLLLQIANRYATSGVAKVCVASMEMLPRFYLGWMVCQGLHEDIANERLRDEIFDRWSQNLFVIDHYGSLDSNLLLETMKYASRRFGISHFIVDSLMKMKFPARERMELQADFVQDLKDFAMEEKAHVHLVAHPRKGERDQDVPDKVDVRGPSEITDLADNVFTIVRSDALPTGGVSEAILHLKKNRKYGAEGRVRLLFVEDWRLFGQADAPRPEWLAEVRETSKKPHSATQKAPILIEQVQLFTHV